MAYYNMLGMAVDMPPMRYTPGQAPGTQTALLDANAVEIHMTGRVDWKGTGNTKNISAVHVQAGTNSTMTATVRFALQDPDLANTPTRGDGTDDQFVDVTTFPSSNSIWSPGALNVVRAVTRGDKLAVVLKVTAFTSGSIQVLGGLLGATATTGSPAWSRNAAGFTSQNGAPMVVLEFDDGSFGTFEGSMPAAITTESFNSGSSPAERGIKGTFGFKTRISGAWIHWAPQGNTRDFSVKLYQGSTLKETVSVDANMFNSTGGRGSHIPFTSTYDVASGDVWYITILPSTASSSDLYMLNFADANKFQTLPGGTDFVYASFTAGTPTADTTKRPVMGFLLTAFDDGAGGSGGSVDSGNLSGGLQ